ncbi:MAG: efflux RND transporter periplasmic adaptor subunit, partial [Pseudomonadota bacterium]
IIIVLLGGGGFTILQATAPKPEQADEKLEGLSVFSQQIERGDLTFTVEAQGDVRPQREITVAPQLAGRIAYVSPDFIDGGFIEAGQVLVRLESADYELGVVRAQAVVASAEQRLERENAEAVIARQDLDELGITDSSPLARREPQLLDAQANLNSAKAQLADAELALRRTAIIAPFTGRVRQETVDIGQFVGIGQSLGQIFATDIVEVSMPITDEELGRLGIPIAFAETEVQKGPDVTFRASVGGQPREWTGRVTRSAAAVNTQTRLINVIAELADPYGAGADNGAPMAPGLFVSASIAGASLKDLHIAPRAALRGGDQIFIGDAGEGKLRIFDVDLVFSNTQGAWFRSDDIKVGDLAIVSPIQAPFDGMSIRILERLPDGTIFRHTQAGGAAEAPPQTVSASSIEGGSR